MRQIIFGPLELSAKGKDWILNRRFVIQMHYLGWGSISVGISFCFRMPNIEIHLPLGFIRIGWTGVYCDDGIELYELVGEPD